MLLLFAATWGAFALRPPAAPLGRPSVVRLRALTEEPPTTTKEQVSLDSSSKEYYIESPFYLDGERPMSAWALAAANFLRQGATLLLQLGEGLGLVPPDPTRPPECLRLVLENDDVAAAEKRREQAGGRVEAHPVSRYLYDIGCLLLDNLFENRPIQRFWFLEVVARIPYFSYVSVLHLYESLGWWRACELRKVHNAEEWNELHHLLVMEALGGNARWSDRFLGYHTAILYYWALVLVYFCSPRIAYQFMELLEAHAVDTYSTFVASNRARLARLPAPKVACSYYVTGDLYLFDDFQLLKPPGSRRPPCDTLLDVFVNICEDEGEHVKTMRACQDYASFGKGIVSPHLAAASSSSANNNPVGEHPPPNDDDQAAYVVDEEDENDGTSRRRRRRRWKEWAADINVF
ncbi:hypothetical protein CTAYLR_010441 [Chrysophaeum taylorii]|uniref:Ubiquinol oxidase n=1 Tax=Chrysophaeum taylorii TaxID=2483200 RepID=A0AAD7XHF3_9STRA|nr:hypothetical protein CTAYLR_010441 [Chrysophaeum taylorii]